MIVPEISIVMATYNRSNILSYSIASVISQTFENWELLVIGDCCTDNSEQVVSDFKDNRIRFINLPVNFGEQSGPNNEGLKRTRGNYIAFLNHDDLWFNDHLETGLRTLLKHEADLVFASGVVDHGEGIPLDVIGIVSDRRGYHPSLSFIPASNWLFRKELVQEIGLWRPARELYLVPSHDWQKRVFDAGKRIVFTKKITVIALPSSSRQNAYLDRSQAENEKYFARINDPEFRVELFSRIIFDFGQLYYHDEKIYFGRFLRRKIRNLLICFGWNTIELRFFFKFGKGGLIKKYRKQRGLL